MKLKNKIYNHLKNSITSYRPEIAIILGSGLGYLVEKLNDPIIIPTSTIPGYPVSTVPGHAGNIVLGQLGTKKVLFFQGRVHAYEGYSLQDVTTPVQIVDAFNIPYLIVTNSAGGLNPQFSPGDLMIITDHINLMFKNPLIGPIEKDEIRFPDMSSPYDTELISLAKQTALDLKISIQSGVYIGVTGPNYETRSEVRYLRAIGGDAVGMSTVPEVIVAAQKNIRTLGISCISNLAAGLSSKPLTHEEVKETAESIKETFGTLVTEIIQRIN